MLTNLSLDVHIPGFLFHHEGNRRRPLPPLRIQALHKLITSLHYVVLVEIINVVIVMIIIIVHSAVHHSLHHDNNLLNLLHHNYQYNH